MTISGLSAEELENSAVKLGWWTDEAGSNGQNGTKLNQLNTGLETHSIESPTPAYGFCIPDNPVLEAWRLEAELTLYKLRTCRGISGLEQPRILGANTLDFGNLPAIGAGGTIPIPDTSPLQPTQYRYRTLIERAKQLANMAQQMESAMLSALEKRDAELYYLLKAGQDVELTQAGVRLNRLKVREAEGGIILAELQTERAQIQEEHYDSLIKEGKSFYELASLGHTAQAIALSTTAGNLYGVSEILEGIKASFTFGLWGSPGDSAAQAFSAMASAASSAASLYQMLASFERREQDWTLARNLANQDIRIGNQQIRLAKDRLRIVNQEHHISELQAEHARETLDFLVNKFTNAELYDWMSGVLEGIYSTFLHQATSVARLVEQQLAFERQSQVQDFIQSNYWGAPLTMEAGFNENGENDRRGLTGSARLLQDITQLDQYAFTTDRRKHQLTKTISLAQRAPAEFQLFRNSGRLRFETTMEEFDRDFPGHYLRLIKRIRVSVIALIPPTDGIKATLAQTCVSRVVNGAPFFQENIIPMSEDVLSLTTPINATGQFEFELQQQNEMLRPFEGNGVATFWEFTMPKAANHFDYNAIADVVITIDYSALHSEPYKQQVIQNLNRTFTADRAFSFRQEFADQWYDLNHPELVAEEQKMQVGFEVLREDFPANLEELKMMQLVLYFSRKDGFTEEVSDVTLTFDGQGAPANTSGGLISTR